MVIDRNFYEAAVGNMEKVLGKPGFYQIKSVVYTHPVGKQVEDGLKAAADRPKPPRVPLFQIITGYTLIGHNSDGSKQMLAKITEGHLRGYRVAGIVNAGAYNETASVKITHIIAPDGSAAWPASGYFVDASTRMPQVKGKVDRHILNNLLFGAVTKFAQAYASALKAGAVGFGGIVTSVDTGRLVRGSGVEAAANTVSDLGQFKRPTLKAPAGIAVGMVFTSMDKQAQPVDNSSGKKS